MKSVKVTSAVVAVLVSVVAVLLYSRAPTLYLFYSNAPSRIERINNFKNVNTRFVDVVQNCEDAVLDADKGFVLLSCDPGRGVWNTVMGPLLNSNPPPETGLYMWRYTDNSSSPRPEQLKLLDFSGAAEDFHPLGIEYHSTSQTLFVANHARSNSRIEIFKLFSQESAATHVRTLDHPLLAAPNAIAALSESEIIVTNDHYFLHRNQPLLALLETYLGAPGGSVVYVDLGPDAAKLVPRMELLARMPFANGMVILNATALAVASSSTTSVRLYSIERGSETQAPRLKHTRTVPVPFLPDNLSVDVNGKLLIAGHPHGPTLEKVAKNSARWNAPGAKGKEGCDFRGLSGIAEWTEEDGLRMLFVGDEFATSSTAVRDVDRQIGVATGLYERGVLVWNE